MLKPVGSKAPTLTIISQNLQGEKKEEDKYDFQITTRVGLQIDIEGVRLE